MCGIQVFTNLSSSFIRKLVICGFTTLFRYYWEVLDDWKGGLKVLHDRISLCLQVAKSSLVSFKDAPSGWKIIQYFSLRHRSHSLVAGLKLYLLLEFSRFSTARRANYVFSQNLKHKSKHIHVFGNFDLDIVMNKHYPF